MIPEKKFPERGVGSGKKISVMGNFEKNVLSWVFFEFYIKFLDIYKKIGSFPNISKTLTIIDNFNYGTKGARTPGGYSAYLLISNYNQLKKFITGKNNQIQK